MSRARSASQPSAGPASTVGETGPGWWAPLLIVAAVALAYANSFAVPFLFDDRGAIVENRSLDAFATALRPPVEWGVTVAGRPLLNLSFAVNRWLGGDDVWGYHLGNVAIHALAALALFGVVRRTLRTAPLRETFSAGAARWFALGAALLWALHPLQTESVTYLAQRAESLAGLLLLLALYAFIRGRDGPRGWTFVAVAACWLGMAAKEVMAVAPLLMLLWDRTFAAGSFAAALRARRRTYAACAAGWLLLGWLVFGADVRGGSAGFATGVTPWSYALKQAEALAHYLRLVAWPHPLVLDYGTDVVTDATRVLPQLAVVAALLGATGWALVRAPRLGFLGAWFFLVLAPTSSVIPVVTQTMAEHRLYLALAPAVVLALLAARRWLPAPVAGGAVGVITAAALLATVVRNQDYRSELALWEQVAARRPQNARAHYNVGVLLLGADRTADAVPYLETAVALQPDYFEALNNLGSALVRLGRAAEALPRYEAAVRIVPDSARSLNNLAVAQLAVGRADDALATLDRALAFDARYSEAQFNRGNALGRLGRFADAIAAFETARRLAPEDERIVVNLAQALAGLGRLDEALAQLAPAAGARDSAALRVAAGQLCLQMERFAEAAGHFTAALAVDPTNIPARYTLAVMHAQRGRRAEAAAELRTLLGHHPDFAPAKELLAQLGGGR